MKIPNLIPRLATAAALLVLSTLHAQTQTIETMAPVVVKTFPIAGLDDVSPGIGEIKVTFSKAMTDNSWSWSSAWKDSTPEIIGKPHYEADHKTCVTEPHRLTPAPIQQVAIDDDFWSPKLKVWREVTIPDCFAPIESEGLRLEVQLQPEWSGGILEWKVESAGDAP